MTQPTDTGDLDTTQPEDPAEAAPANTDADADLSEVSDDGPIRTAAELED